MLNVLPRGEVSLGALHNYIISDIILIQGDTQNLFIMQDACVFFFLLLPQVASWAWYVVALKCLCSNHPCDVSVCVSVYVCAWLQG